MTFREELLNVGDLRLNVMTGPASGAPLWMFHGVIRRWQTFLPILPLLASRWQVYGLDFPGHGKSSRSPGNYLVADYISAAAAALRQAADQPVILYGHSLGAMVAAGVAAVVPEKVRAVFLEDPPLDTLGRRIAQTAWQSYFAGLHTLAQAAAAEHPTEREVAKRLAQLEVVNPITGQRQPLAATRDAVSLRFLASCLLQMDPDVLAPVAAGNWLESYNWRSAAKYIAAPVLLLQADDAAGGMLADADARQFVEAAGDCLLIKFAGAPHNLHIARTQEVFNLVAQFLESLPE